MTTVSKLFKKISGQPDSYTQKSRYVFGKTLGAGTFGVVRHARDKETGEDVAIKILLKKALKSSEGEQTVKDEIHLIEALHHPHIVGFRDWFESKDKFYIVTQLALGGELFDRIIAKTKFTENDAGYVILQILEALDYLHDRDIVHRDLKPENILLLNGEDTSPVVIADFGIAKKLCNKDELLTSTAGSLGYAAPEVLQGTGHGKPCDVWSLGVITYTLLCGYSPFRAEDVDGFLREVYTNNVVFHERYWRDVSLPARELILKCLSINPQDRCTVKELLEDPWLAPIKCHAADKSADLLENIKSGFNARTKLRQVIEVVRMQNKIKKLRKMEGEEDSDIAYHPLDNDWSQMRDSLDSDDKSSVAANAFQQIVKAATENKDRVSSYKDE